FGGARSVISAPSWSCHMCWSSTINRYIDPDVKHSCPEICFPWPHINRLTPLDTNRLHRFSLQR
ncbi:unnamed protein product, partial [Candidula unifasciata]